MTQEIKTISVIAYRDKEGNPCCAKDFSKGEVCRFYRAKKFGNYETCVFSEEDDKTQQSLGRRNNGNGTLIPLDNCPVWNSADAK